MNRWRHRLAEINSIEALTHATPDVQNVQNVQNARPFRHFVQIGQIEQHADLAATSSPALDTDTSDEWRGRLREALSIPYPDSLNGDRWECACRGIEQFARRWAAKAGSLNGTFDELFALTKPFANVSLQGAAWFVGDLTVTSVTADEITLRTVGGATQRIHRKRPQL